MSDSSPRIYNIENISVVVKRTKEEVAVAQEELKRLHAYIQSSQEIDKEWAKEQIAAITRMILLPDEAQLKAVLRSKVDLEP